ncbi:MAG TPA: adenylate/guanylate cyclase domain-containing protein [Deltaproteobacteria bacterium]|nr:adenylate/guanylate cyclase domain-containing protein [Pseudomonadota bacterium]HNR50792.1 adenylate/guanylate cyclase domain-containing protein [Deltaproteobacteria bacterium]HRC97493.1 adenylate/guanylate cyclase domain-containing protein [Deltaproteobacteria bacterium]
MTQRNIETILKERIVSLEEGYEQKIAELSLLKELGEALKGASLAHWNQLFIGQLDIIKRATGIFSVSVMLVDEETQQLYVVSASARGDSPKRAPILLKKGEGVAGKVLETGRTLYIPDVIKDPNFSDRGTDQKGSLACVPIISEGSCIGVINFRDNVASSFGPNDLRFFELIADQLSITASLVRTYQDLLDLEKKRMNLGRYFSPGLAERLVADERMTGLGGQRKMVSIVFADVSDFTSLVEKHAVEDVVEVLNRFFETVVPIIFRHGGMLDKFLGDGVMAVFGIPDPDDADPVRAIECAVDIQKGMETLKAQLEKDGLFPIDVGAGIATGVVLAGNIGTKNQMNYTVIGEPVNLAQRLESISRPGEIIVSNITTEMIPIGSGISVSFEPMGTIRVKGIERDVSPMKVIYRSSGSVQPEKRSGRDHRPGLCGDTEP